MTAFIAAQRAGHNVPVAVACRALRVSPAWFYTWRGGDASRRPVRRRALAELVAMLFAGHRGRYGSPRIAAELREWGWRVGDNTVAALMAEQGLVARAKRRCKGTTHPGKGRCRAPDQVQGDFHAERINQRWFGDGTEMSTDEGSRLRARPHRSRRGQRAAAFADVKAKTRGWATALTQPPADGGARAPERPGRTLTKTRST